MVRINGIAYINTFCEEYWCVHIVVDRYLCSNVLTRLYTFMQIILGIDACVCLVASTYIPINTLTKIRTITYYCTLYTYNVTYIRCILTRLRAFVQFILGIDAYV